MAHDASSSICQIDDSHEPSKFPASTFAGNPSLVQEPFLLVFRISHIVTAAHKHLIQKPCIALYGRRVVENPPGFPAYSRLLSASSPARRAAPLSC